MSTTRGTVPRLRERLAYAVRSGRSRLAARVVVLRATWALHQAARRRRAQLRAELASYGSASDRLELEAMLDSYPDSMTREVRAILAEQDQARAMRHWGGLGPVPW